jgi:hypothetical protein
VTVTYNILQMNGGDAVAKYTYLSVPSRKTGGIRCVHFNNILQEIQIWAPFFENHYIFNMSFSDTH